MPLAQLIEAAGLQLVAGDADQPIAGVTADSRAVEPNFLFVATSGLRSDGHNFIEQALAKGATAVLAKAGQLPPRAGVTWLEVSNPNAALGLVAAAFYGEPSQQLALVGITGTNGKTTVATLCCDAFTALGYTCGLIGTVEVRVGQQPRAATHTTPDAVAIQSLLAEMRDAGCAYVFMEVSSHALVQHRTVGCQFVGAVFTNISHDHLDYHGDMLSYISAKKLLFDGLSSRAFALVNVDDKRGEVMLQNTRARQRRYAYKQFADYKGRILEEGLRGLHLQIDERDVYTRIAGRFNAYNLLAALWCGSGAGARAGGNTGCPESAAGRRWQTRAGRVARQSAHWRGGLCTHARRAEECARGATTGKATGPPRDNGVWLRGRPGHEQTPAHGCHCC